MKPEENSRHLLSITQSKAKMYEYDVPIEDHISIPRNPANLFPLTVGMVGDVAANIMRGGLSLEEVPIIRENLPFSARFFDNYRQTLLNREIDTYLLLIGSAAYYLSDIPGSSKLLAKQVDPQILDLEGIGLDKVLAWILRGEYSQPIDLGDSKFQEILLPIIDLIREYYSTGNGGQELFERINSIRIFFYNNGTARQLLLADLIGAITHKRISNSTWATIPRYSNLPVERWTTTFQKDTFIKELWPAQHLLGQQGVYIGKSAIVQMPTSAGKTKAIEIILRSAFYSGRATLAIIVAPFRALCHEIKDNLIKAFRGEDILVNELSDTLQVDYSPERLLRNNQIIIVTPEKLNYVLHHSPQLAEHIGLLIYDEGHQFDNGIRGITYELLLTSLKSKIPPCAQTILISAVISNAQQIGLWLLGENYEIILGSPLQPNYRSIAFASWRVGLKGFLRFVNPSDIDTLEFFVPRIIEQYNLGKRPREKKERIFPDKTAGNEIALYLGLKLVRKGTVAIFCGRKASVTGICIKAIDIFDRHVPLETPQQISGNRAEILKISNLYAINLGADAAVTKSAEIGIFAHHNNIPHGIRLAVEFAIKEGLASFVVCTSTLAQGVNLPIRYLFVTSVYQGGEQIKVRDFQNLIGRSGRSDLHTEGSIIFPDPVVFDERENEGSWRWDKARDLLNPSNSEPCTSSLYSLFEKLKSDDDRYILDIDPFELIEEYNDDFASLISTIEGVAEEYANQKFSINGLQNQIAYKIHLLSAIESYLMANWDETQPDFDEEAVLSLAKGTLAYFLADQNENETQKEQIENLFIILARNITEKIPDIHKRIIFGKTLFGVQDVLSINNWLEENIAHLLLVNDSEDFLETLWVLFAKFIHVRPFKKCDKPAIRKQLALLWIEGVSFSDLFQIILDAGAKISANTKQFNYKIEDVVDICENGFAYDGMLLIGAVIELIQEMDIEGLDNLIDLMEIFQKQMKYGLSNPIAIMLYELGFSDRFVAMDLSTIIEEVPSDKELIIQSLKGSREQVFGKLNHYPEYFSEVYRIVAT